MMTQEEFNALADQMQKDGVPLTHVNLMIRTELPRHRIDDFLEVYRNPVQAPPTEISAAPQQEPKPTMVGKGINAIGNVVNGATIGVANGVSSAAKGIKNRVTNSKKDSETTEEEDESQREDEDAFDFIFRPSKRNVGAGMAMGFIGGPLGFFYSAPWSVAIASTLGYFAVAIALYHVPVVGKTTLLPYVLSVTHLVCAVASGWFSFQFNRNGFSRTTPEKPVKKKRKK